MQKTDGFSYAEMLIVIMILLIMMHILTYHPFDENQADIDEVNDELTAVINYYQTLAMKTGRSITLIFPPGRSEMKMISRPLGIEASYKLRNGYFYAGNSSRAVTVTFNGETIDHGATINYYINRQRFALVFQLVTGRVRIEKA